MTICLGKSSPFGLLCVFREHLSFFYLYPSFPFSFEGEMWDLIVLIPNHCLSVYFEKDMYIHIFRFVLGRAYRGFTSGFLSLRDFSVAISVSPHVCFILVLILISLFPR